MLREQERFGFYKQLVQNAINTNTIYKDFRWLFVEKNQDSNIVHNIKKTVQKRKKNTDYVLKLNLEKTKVLHTYGGIRPVSVELDKPYKFVEKMIKNKEIFNGFYYIHMAQCPENVLETYSRPIIRYTKRVVQINSLTKEEIIHTSINEICLKLGGTIEVMLDAIKNKTDYKGYFWKFLDDKHNKKMKKEIKV